MPDKTYTCYLLITWQPIPVWFWVLRSVRGSPWSEQASADPQSSGEPTTFREATAEPEIFLKFNNIFPLPLSIILEIQNQKGLLQTFILGWNLIVTILLTWLASFMSSGIKRWLTKMGTCKKLKYIYYIYCIISFSIDNAFNQNCISAHKTFVILKQTINE